MVISVERAMQATAPRARMPVAAGFALPPTAAPASMAGVQRLAAAAPLMAAGPTARDVAARRRGSALLAGLSAMQRGLLGGRVDPAELARLPDLLEGEDGDDPALAEALQAIALRARIESERWRG